MILDVLHAFYLIHWGKISHLNLKIISITGLARQLALGILCLHHQLDYLASMEDVGIWIPVFLLLQQVLCPLRNLPRPYIGVIFNPILLITSHPLKWAYVHLLNIDWTHLISLLAMIHALRKLSFICCMIPGIIPGTTMAQRQTNSCIWNFSVH